MKIFQTLLNKGPRKNLKVENVEFEFIPDAPISADKKDELYFGYKQIAKTLAKIAEKSPTPFTIGLFGKWGTGKSTILNQLENFLDPNTVMVIFDVWKYESDALRRSFILDIALQLKERGILNDSFIEKIKEKLYLDISKPREEFRWSWKGLILGFGIFLAVLFVQLTFTNKFTLTAVLSSFLAGLIGSLSELIRTTISVDKITIAEDRVNSPEEFSEEFKNLFNEIGDKRLIIAIDNLDRVDRDKAVELLGTIKTFLTSEKSKDGIVFVISCDDQAIKEYLMTVYVKENQNSEFDPDEFLRKFFNTVLKIPKFLNLELDSYTKALLKQTKITVFKNNLDLELIINYTFRDNPREIKQFINNLTTYYLIALERIEAEELDKAFINKNIPFIAKLLIIRQKFSSVYNLMEQKTLREATTWQECMEIRDQLESLLNEKGKHAFREFLENTDWIKPSSDNIAVFFTLRTSPEEKTLTGWDQFLDAAINKRIETAAKLIRRFKS